MTRMRLLVLGGTGEARQVAAALASLRDLTVTVSLAGAERAPVPYGVATRIGGFGGDEGFRAWLRHDRAGAVLDATHPFSAGISLRSARICAEEGVDYAQLMRPAWRPGPGDLWHFAEDEPAAAGLVPEGARVLIATGRQRLERFGPMEGRRVLVRQIGSAPEGAPPFADGDWQVSRPPFGVDAEEELFARLGLTWMIVRNAGGGASRAKLDAARRLGIEVAMIRRPPRPDALRLETVAAAVTWARRRAFRRNG